MTDPHNSAAYHVVDAVAAVVTIGALANILPPLAALFTIAWTAMRMYEMVTGRPFSTSWIARRVTGKA